MIKILTRMVVYHWWCSERLTFNIHKHYKVCTSERFCTKWALFNIINDKNPKKIPRKSLNHQSFKISKSLKISISLKILKSRRRFCSVADPSGILYLVLCVGSLCYYAKVDCHVSLEKKVTNYLKGSAVKNGIIFTLVLLILITEVKTRTMMGPPCDVKNRTFTDTSLLCLLLVRFSALFCSSTCPRTHHNYIFVFVL